MHRDRGKVLIDKELAQRNTALDRLDENDDLMRKQNGLVTNQRFYVTQARTIITFTRNHRHVSISIANIIKHYPPG